MTFRYSGSKGRLLKHLPKAGKRRLIIEPFAGSLAYSLHYKPENFAGAEASPEVRDLWTWLKTATIEDLERLEELRPEVKVDARELARSAGLTLAEMTLLRLTCSGAYVGQLSSWILYPQHSVNFDKLKLSLPYIQRALAGILEDYRDPLVVGLSEEEGAFAFVDPPYIGTHGNYSKNPEINPAEVSDFVQSLKCPVLMTYGDGAPEVFPDFEWTQATVRKVPILRGGGTRERTEWYTYLE